MGDKQLTRIGAGFYVDANRSLYVNVREFLTAHDLPDTPEVRQAVWDQIGRDFGIIGITALPDD
jgi:hypothetical protein